VALYVLILAVLGPLLAARSRPIADMLPSAPAPGPRRGGHDPVLPPTPDPGGVRPALVLSRSPTASGRRAS
jgi:hypothetical protein